MRVFAYIARRYNSAAESTSLLSSVASLAIIIGTKKRSEIRASIHVTINITLEKRVVAKGAKLSSLALPRYSY